MIDTTQKMTPEVKYKWHNGASLTDSVLPGSKELGVGVADGVVGRLLGFKHGGSAEGHQGAQQGQQAASLRRAPALRSRRRGPQQRLTLAQMWQQSLQERPARSMISSARRLTVTLDNRGTRVGL